MTWKEKIKREWNENPLNVIAVASGAVVATTMLLGAVSQARSRNAYARQINQRLS